MLIPSNWSVWFRFWRGNPIPTSISMFPQTPNIIQSTSCRFTLGVILIFFGLLAASIYNHHSLCWSLLTNCSTVIDSWSWAYFVLELVFLPLEWTFVDIKQPYVVFCPTAWVSSKNDQIRLIKYHCMPVSLARSHTFICNFNDFPSRSEINTKLLFSQIQNIKLIFEEPLTTRSSTAVDDHLHVWDFDSSMGCSFGWYESLFKIEFFPLHEGKIEEIGFVGYDEFSYIKEMIPAMETAPPKRTALSSATMVSVCPNLGGGISPETWALWAANFFIKFLIR